MKRLIEAIELMIMARVRLEEVDYVYDTLKKYKKLNPFIAKSNTLLADKENMIRFDGYATEALDLFHSISEGEVKRNNMFRALSGILLREYRAECKALESRLQIYDSSLMGTAKEIRAKNIVDLERCSMEDNDGHMRYVFSLMKENAGIRIKAMKCDSKIAANREIYLSYSRKILFRKNARKTAEQAESYIAIYEHQRDELEAEKRTVDKKIMSEIGKIK